MYLYISRNKLRNDKCRPTFQETKFETTNVGLQFSKTTLETQNVPLHFEKQTSKRQMYLYISRNKLRNANCRPTVLRNKLRNDKCRTTRAINLSVFVEKIDATIAIKEQKDVPCDTAKQKHRNGIEVEVWCEVRNVKCEKNKLLV